MKPLIATLLFLSSFVAYAEGRCPPGQFPVGGQGVEGCAPIPGAGGGDGGPSAPVPTGEWETRWGAVVEDASSANLATGPAVSKRSKRDAIAAARLECEKAGGRSCKTRITYYNQCVAIADPTEQSRLRGGTQNAVYAAQDVEGARALALSNCEAAGSGQECTIVYSACSVSEFKKF